MLNLPEELCLYIATFLDVPTVLSLRKTCKALSRVTYEKTLWLDLLLWMRTRLPIPYISSDLEDVSAKELERLLIHALRAEESWLLPRGPATILKQADATQDITLLALTFVLDRYLLTVKSSGLIIMWDLFEDHTKPSLSLYASHQLGESGWLSCVSSLNASKSTLFLALNHDEIQTACILSVPLHQPKLAQAGVRASFKLLSQLHLPSPKIIRAINPQSKLALLTRATLIDVIDWTNNKCFSVSTPSEDLEDLWNGITALRFCGPYILCFRTRSVDLYPLPNPNKELDQTHALPVLTHHFANVTFRRVSLSSIQPVDNLDIPSATYKLSFLAYDLFAGLFHYALTVTIAPIPAISLSLIAMHPMALALSHPPFDSVEVATPASFGMPERAGAFATAWALGPEGRRGVWIERTRSSTDRTIVAFHSAKSEIGAQTDIPAGDDANEHDNGHVQENIPNIDGRAIMGVHSYDLRGAPSEDITTCALSEARGIIAFGTRSGAIKIIYPGRTPNAWNRFGQ